MYPAMLSAFTFASSNAALPASMETCDKRLGVAKKVYSFSLPLGATINMDGSCITQMISALFMAKIFGIPITGSVVFSLALAIFALSVGAPGVSAYAEEALSWAVGAGLINGTTDADGNLVLDARGGSTRAQVAAMIQRFCEKVVR